jgi:hypothetical protein
MRLPASTTYKTGHMAGRRRNVVARIWIVYRIWSTVGTSGYRRMWRRVRDLAEFGSESYTAFVEDSGGLHAVITGSAPAKKLSFGCVLRNGGHTKPEF